MLLMLNWEVPKIFVVVVVGRFGHKYGFTQGYPGRLAPGTRPSRNRRVGFN